MAVDAGDQLRKLIADLGALPADLKRDLRPRMKEAVHPVIDQMKENAAWSTRIPGAIKISSSFSGDSPSVKIITDSREAPEARPLEHDGNEGTFRHPVFGNRDNWVSQPARPFFYRAVTEKGDEVRNAIAEIVSDVLAQHGF